MTVRYSAKQKRYISEAQTRFNSLCNGEGRPSEQLKYVLDLLQKAGVDLSALDSTGRSSPKDIESRLRTITTDEQCHLSREIKRMQECHKRQSRAGFSL
jgi:hypothetical protein